MLLKTVAVALAAAAVLNIAHVDGFQSLPPSFDEYADWEHFGGHSYAFIKERMGWDEARKRCRSVDADLASVHSEEENKFIYELIKLPYTYLGKLRAKDLTWDQHAWIGLNRRNGTWEWSDNTPLDFTNWDQTRLEPNNFIPEEECVEMLADIVVGGHWADVGCSMEDRGFVCKKIDE